MTNKLATFGPIDANSLDPLHWLESLLHLTAQHKLLTDAQLHNIRRQLLELLEFLAVRYTCGASTSVRVETAQSLMAGASYSIAHTLKKLPTPQAALCALREDSIRSLYDAGQSQLRCLLADTKLRFKHLADTSASLQSLTWLSTLREGLPAFFSAYHVYDAPHETPGLIDYPTALPLNNASGVEYISRYINRLTIENSFICHWPEDEANGLLRACGGIGAPINAFLLVLTNAIGMLLCGRRAVTLSLTDNDRSYLRKRLSGLNVIPLKKILQKTVLVLCDNLAITDTATRRYAASASALLSSSVYCALQTDTLSRVFLTIRPSRPPILFQDAPRMDDASFRELVTKLRESSLAPVAIVKTRIHSLADMTDLFETGCLTADNIAAILQTLEDTALAALLHISRVNPADGLHTAEAEQLWHTVLWQHFRNMDSQQQSQIREMAKRIRISSH